MSAEAISFALERRRHVGFVGRDRLLARLDQLLIADTVDRWVVVTGGPGMGKSAVLAAWLARREMAGVVVPHHFIRRGWSNWDDPEALVGSLVAQIEARFPGARELEADARLALAARLAAALLRVSERALVPGGERLVLLIDGLDEYDPPPGALPVDPLAAFLPYALPPGVSVLCASRPRHPYVDALATRGVLEQIDLDDAPSFADDNAATVRVFWEHAAPKLGLDAHFVAEAVGRAGGNLQHAEMLRRHLSGVPPEQRRVEEIPRGLAASIASAWERVAIEPTVVDGLSLLCAARDALTLDELGRVAGWTLEPQRRAFLRGARELLIETQRTDGVSEYRLHHDSIRAHVAKAIGIDRLAAHHLALAQRLATWPAPVDAAARRYALHHALLHRAEAGAWADAWRVAADMTFLEAKCRELGVHDTEADVARAAARCRASGDEMHSGRLAELARALGRESHWLRAAPEATTALMWNRLRRSGWSANELDEQLRVPERVEFLRVRHAATRESPALLRDLAGHTDVTTACAVTPDGRHVVSASRDQTLKVWELASGSAVATFQGHTRSVTACAVTPDGWHVVSASDDKTLKVWELASGRTVVTLQGHTRSVTACAVTPDGRYVVSASDDKTLGVWKLASGRAVATLQGHADKLTACAVTPDGRHVVSASWDKTLKVWELASGRAVATLQGHTSWVRACVVTPDGRHVISASQDKTLKVWELTSGSTVATIQGHTSWVRACAVTPDGRHVVSASQDKTLKVWELASGRAIATLQGHTDRLTACAVTPDGRAVVSASGDQTLKVWELSNGRVVTTVQGHTDDVNACTVAPDGRHVVSASEDETLKVWELSGGHAIATFLGHSDGVTGCAVTPDGRYVVSASTDWKLKVWELSSGHEVNTLRGHSHWVLACAITPDGGCVVSASRDKTLKVWELSNGRAVATLQGHTDDVIACAVTPDGRHVVSASKDRTLKVWELASGRATATLQGHTDSVNACAVTPDGRHVVSASDDRTLKVWELASGRALATLQGHTDSVSACAVTPDGRHAVSASGDQTLKVWDLATHSYCITHRGDAAYLAIAVSATTIIASDAAGVVWFLDVPPCLVSSIDAPSAPEPPMTHTISPAAAAARATGTSPSVDIGIVTIRDDEFRAVLAAFPNKAGTLQGVSRAYTLRHADAGGGERYRIAVLRLIEQGQGEAQDAARDLIDDLGPRLVLVVGIAGGRPSADVKLGDVVVSTRIHDFTVEARKPGEPAAYAVTGGPIDKALAGLVANLAAREDELGDWTAELPKQPPVSWTEKGQLSGPPDWQRELGDALEHHHGPEATPREPAYAAGPIASSDRLVKDPELLIPWLQTARNLLAIEMESGGVYRAARERCPMLAIRGISDIVGLKRADAWTKYACASAAAFTRAFLRTRPVELASAAPETVNPLHAISRTDPALPRHDRHVSSPPTESTRTPTALDIAAADPIPPMGRTFLYATAAQELSARKSKAVQIVGDSEPSERLIVLSPHGAPYDGLGFSLEQIVDFAQLCDRDRMLAAAQFRGDQQNLANGILRTSQGNRFALALDGSIAVLRRLLHDRPGEGRVVQRGDVGLYSSLEQMLAAILYARKIVELAGMQRYQWSLRHELHGVGTRHLMNDIPEGAGTSTEWSTSAVPGDEPVASAGEIDLRVNDEQLAVLLDQLAVKIAVRFGKHSLVSHMKPGTTLINLMLSIAINT